MRAMAATAEIMGERRTFIDGQGDGNADRIGKREGEKGTGLNFRKSVRFIVMGMFQKGGDLRPGAGNQD